MDVISPMVYPSTYVQGGGFPGYREAVPYPYQIVYYNTRRALEPVAGSQVTIRPWLQDFPDYAYDHRAYTPSQVRAQMRAARWAGAPGWMLWDPRVRYTPQALRPVSEPCSHSKRTAYLRLSFIPCLTGDSDHDFLCLHWLPCVSYLPHER